MPVLVSPGADAPSGISVKICGLTQAYEVRACADAGARYVGFNFFAKSPRYVTPAQARDLAVQTPIGVAKVALVVNASDDELDAITREVPLDMLQLHGGESPERAAKIKARYGLPVMKAIGIADRADLDQIAEYERVVDQLLIDAKPPKNAVLPGGNGLAFDWSLLAGRTWSAPWMLAGGLTAANAAEAASRTGARQLDVASGVESAPGVKDADMIAGFVRAAQG